MRAFWFIFCEPEKLTTKFHENSENYMLGLFCALSPHVTTNKNFFSGKPAFVIFLFLDFCCCAEFLKEANEQKVGYRHEDQQKGAQTHRLTGMNSKVLPLQGFKKRQLRLKSSNS